MVKCFDRLADFLIKRLTETIQMLKYGNPWERYLMYLMYWSGMVDPRSYFHWVHWKAFNFHCKLSSKPSQELEAHCIVKQAAV